ncbi:MAG: NAD+ synthase, partial [Deltaproteobacteria bacterium]|nr:NAD+ synthase [Deltaproteobacteria bacterium]
LAATQACLPQLCQASRGLVLVVGAAAPVAMVDLQRDRHKAANVALVFDDGRHVATVAKRLLPTYDVFDEARWFAAGNEPGLVPVQLGGRTVKLGVTVCEDLWSREDDGPARYACDPVADLAALGAEVLINLSASPFDLGKPARRLELVRGLAREHAMPAVYCNTVGAQDQLIFDGRSFAVDAQGRLLAVGPALVDADIQVDLSAAPGQFDEEALFSPPRPLQARSALVRGIADYVRKCGFKDVLLGLSGGIDSAVVAALAVEALGPEHVLGVAMPGPCSSQGSVDDALELATNLGIRCPILPIIGPYQALAATLEPELARTPSHPYDITDQNLQARLRGTTLMALSNRTGALLLTTGNKSEMAVGYCTLYGDMNGGLAVIGDLPKMLVYAVAESYNSEVADQSRVVIPLSTMTKAPSAELAPNQTDQDNLPPYPLLDAILERFVELGESAQQIVAAGFDAATVKKVVRLVEVAEFKRRQAAPVLRVTRKAFGPGRRIPLARAIPR